jgi:HEAT repeat protein
LFHPDVEVRKQLARELPGMTGVNAVPWLVQLSRDRDPQVRVAAITLMATTGEPSLLDEIEQIAAADPNPRVRLQAKRVAEHRRPRTY